MQSREEPTHEVKEARRAFYTRLDARNTTPLWEVMSGLVTREPASKCMPAIWHYETLRPLLMEAGALITAKEAERRVIVLENPGIRGVSQITQSLYAGLQLILPGEVAPSHRHAASALRFVIEGEGAYTAVDGERTRMHPGDFILTPSWTFHDHGNEGSDPVVWLDGLDVPIVNLFDSSFAEPYGEESQPLSRQEGDALARFGANLLPVEYRSGSLSAPTFCYPYERTREALAWLAAHGPVDDVHGVKMQYVNPASGGYPMPTIGAFVQWLPKGFTGAPVRSTDSTVFCAVEGRGTTTIGGQSFDWGPRDVFVAPSWLPVSHRTETDSVLFSFSDRPAQKALGLWRETR
ncbi:gentisate 1,2-dioxygenase [Burkholderia sp. KK1]|nr:gentisate 1,2-dioxygenase [Burkholderia sp. KK1]